MTEEVEIQSHPVPAHSSHWGRRPRVSDRDRPEETWRRSPPALRAGGGGEALAAARQPPAAGAGVRASGIPRPTQGLQRPTPFWGLEPACHCELNVNGASRWHFREGTILLSTCFSPGRRLGRVESEDGTLRLSIPHLGLPLASSARSKPSVF